jgi:DNA-binding response OmpR family regulator
MMVPGERWSIAGDQEAAAMSEADTRVMVIDDDADARQTLSGVLASEGCEVCSAGDGGAALALIAEFEPHCVILDVEMPGLDGLALSRQLRQVHGHDIVLIGITGHHLGDAKVDATFQLVDHWFTKPIELAKLVKLIRAM